MNSLVKDAYLFFLHSELNSISQSSLAIFMTTMLDVYPMTNLSRCFTDKQYVEDIIRRKSLAKDPRPSFRRSK